MRRLIGFGMLALIGCGADISGPEDVVPGTFLLETIDGAELPQVIHEDHGTTVLVTAGTLVLRSDRSFEATATHQRIPRQGAATETSFQKGTFEWSGSSLRLDYEDGSTDTAALEGQRLTLDGGGRTFVFRLAEPPFTLDLAYTFPALAEDGYIDRFDFTGDGTLWATTSTDLIIKVRSGETTVHDARADLQGEFAGGMFVDHEDRVWVALGNGFAVHDAGSWTRFDAPHVQTPGTSIRDVAVNAAGDILLSAGHATGGGLLLRTGGVWQALTPENSPLPNPSAVALAVDSEGDFWVASPSLLQPGGLTRVSEGAISRVYTADSGLLYDHVAAVTAGHGLVVAGFGNWAQDEPGADGGMQILSTQDESLDAWFPAVTGLTSSRIRSLALTQGGNIWFTTILDEAQPTCATCYSGFGRLTASGDFDVMSGVNADLPPNGFFSWIAADADGVVHVALEQMIYRIRD